MTEVVLAVDIGGTKTAVALAGRDDVPLATSVAPTPAAESPAAVIETVARLARQLLAEAEPTTRLVGVGIGTAGVVDTTAGAIVSATDTFVDWPGTQVRDMVRAALGSLLAPGAPIDVQNDVDAHAYGEFTHGAAAGFSSALIIGVGTGVGGGIIIEDRQLRGAHHVGGEIAHLPVPDAWHLRCPCGRYGHLEGIGSGIGMHAHFWSLSGDRAITDARGVAAAAAAGNAVAQRALTESATAVGRAIAGAATLLDPAIVVVTGGVPNIGEAWWQPMLAAYRAEAIDALQSTPILPGALGDDAPLRGAAAAAWRHL